MFKFKLESILSLRRNTETMCQRELGIVLTQKNQLEKQYNQLVEAREENFRLMRPKYNESLNIDAIKNYKHYDETIKKNQVQLKAELDSIERLVNEKKEALKEAVKQRKIIENLRKIKYEEYIDFCKKEEQQLVDELIAYKYALNDKEDFDGQEE